MKVLSLIIFLIVFSASSFGDEIRAELDLVSTAHKFKEGDLVEGVLKIWPIENADLAEFNQLESMVFGNILTVSDLESLSVSINNTDVVEAKVLMIVKKLEGSSTTSLTYKGLLIPVQLPAIEIENSDKKIQEYFIMDQGTITSTLTRTVAFVVLLIIFSLAVWKRKNIKSFVQSFRVNPIATMMKKYNDLFRKADSRTDYEFIYSTRKEWLTLVKTQAPAYVEFFKTMEIHQYKKSWNEEDLCEIKNCFDIIRGSFK